MTELSVRRSGDLAVVNADFGHATPEEENQAWRDAVHALIESGRLKGVAGILPGELPARLFDGDP